MLANEEALLAHNGYKLSGIPCMSPFRVKSVVILICYNKGITNRRLTIGATGFNFDIRGSK